MRSFGPGESACLRVIAAHEGQPSVYCDHVLKSGGLCMHAGIISLCICQRSEYKKFKNLNQINGKELP